MVTVREQAVHAPDQTPMLYLGLLAPLGYLGVTVLPFWLGAAIHDGLLPARTVGLVAAGEMLAMAVANMATSSFLVRRSIKMLVRASMTVAIFGSLLSMMPHPLVLVVARLLSGAAFGVLNAAVAATAARQIQPQRSLTAMLLMMMPVLALTAFVTPHVVAWRGLAGLFGVLAMICGLGLFLARKMPDRETPAPAGLGLGRVSLSPVALAACFAIAAYSASQYVILPFLVVIGAHISISAATIGIIASSSVLFTLPAPALANALGERIGLALPIGSSLAVMGLGAALVLTSTSVVTLTAGTMLLYFAPSFLLPYAFGLLTRFDNQGSYASTFPGFLMVGAAAGPALAGTFAAEGEFGRMAILAIGLQIASLALFVVALRSPKIALAPQFTP
mgnify:CR=1 FL=1|tara:strand:+ start:3002 stop:4174 length:1173 start_codon:yes stop_codon:yes gene_type:complete